MLSKESQQEKNKQKFPKRISSKVPVNITIHTRNNSNSQKFEKNSYEYSFTKPISYSKKVDNPYSSSYHSYFTLGQTPSNSSSSSSNTTQRAYYNNNNDDDIHKNKKDDKEDDSIDESVTLSILNSKEYARKLLSASKDNFEFEYEKDYKKKDSKNSSYDKNIYNSNKYIVSELVFSPEDSPIVIPEKPSNNNIDMSRSVLFKHSNSSSESLSSTGSKNGPKRKVSLKNTRNSINLTRKRSSSIGNKPRNRSNSASVGNRKVSPNQEFEDFPFHINRNNSLDEQFNNHSVSLPRRIEIRDVRNKVEKRNRSNTLPRSMIISPVKDEKFSYSLPKMEFHSVQDFPVPRVVGYDIRNNFSSFDYDKDKDKDKDYIYNQDLISPTVSEYVEYRTLLKSDNLDLNALDEREERRHRSLSRKGESRYRSLSRDEKRRSSRSRSRQRGREHNNTSPSNNVDGESRYRSLSRTRNEPREDKEKIYEFMDNNGNRDYERERERKDSNRERNNYNEHKDSIRDRNNYERRKSESRDRMSHERRKSESRDKTSHERRKSESRDKSSHERHKSESRSRDHGDRERSRGRDHERRRSSSRHKKSSSCCHKRNKSLSESPLPKNSQIITNSSSSSSSPHPMNSQIIGNTTSSPLPMNSQIISNTTSSPLPINNQIITNSSRGSPLSKANNNSHNGSPLAINTNVINNKFSTTYIQNGSMNKSYLDEKNNSNNKYLDISTQKISTSFNNSNSFANKPFGSMDNEENNNNNKINNSTNNSRIDEIHDLKKFSQDFSGLKILEDILNKPLEEDLDFSTMNRRLYRNKNPSYQKFSTISRLPSQNRNNSYDYNKRRNSDTNYPFDFEKGHNRVNSDQSRNMRNNEENSRSKSKNIFNFFSNHKKSKSYSSINFDNNDNNNKMKTSDFDKMIKGNDTIKIKLKPSNKICTTPYLTNEEGFVNDDIFTDVNSKDYEGNFKSFLNDKKKNKKGSYNQPINNIKDYMPLFRINMMDNSMGKKKYKDDFMEQYGAYNNKNDTHPFNHFNDNDNDGNNRKSQRSYNKYGSLKRSY